ncbi:DUF1641 domain-containing protein [Chloroflexus sp.]|uniref:DUF1641 domain-containing protein n=1 Tax=Chloroflexus sp. TaxID=1904827 RepID=UPI0026286A04|nr:DUF1641 domain-containing protein [uncultured Chloroflexus sp.]
MSSNGAATHTDRPLNAAALLERLNEPQTAAALHRLLDHAELLAFSASAVDSLLQRGEVIADNVAASVHELRAALPAESGALTDQLTRLTRTLPQLTETIEQLATLTNQPAFQRLMATLSKPQTLDALDRLLGQSELLAFLVSALDHLLARGDELTENIRSAVEELRATMQDRAITPDKLIDAFIAFLPYFPRLVAVAPNFIEVIEKIEPFVASDEFDALLDSGVFHPDTVRLVGEAGDAFVASRESLRHSPKPIGLLGLLRALRDPDVQRAAGLIVEFGRRFGRSLA